MQGEKELPETDWRDKWTRGDSKVSSEVIGKLLDIDIRLSTLPAGVLRDKLNHWLNDIGENLVSGSNDNGSSTSTPFHIELLRQHIIVAAYRYKNQRLAHSLAWLLSTLFWGLAALILSFNMGEIPLIEGASHQNLELYGFSFSLRVLLEA